MVQKKKGEEKDRGSEFLVKPHMQTWESVTRKQDLAIS